MRLVIEGASPLRGTVQVPADKSITHRALLLAAVAEGTSQIVAHAAGADNFSTAQALHSLGAKVVANEAGWVVEGVGRRGFSTPASGGVIDCGNSGTTMRLLAGMLSGAGVAASLVGDASLSRRPMGRVCAPLRMLGAAIAGRRDGQEREVAPLHIGAGAFTGGRVDLDVASAQVKSALLLAGLMAGKAVTVVEPTLSRDHTERLLQGWGVALERSAEGRGAQRVALKEPASAWSGRGLEIPGDFSAAAFLLSAALLVPDSVITVGNLGLNPTRTGLLDYLAWVGWGVDSAALQVDAVGPVDGERGGEPVATVTARYGGVGRCVEALVGGGLIARLIDELVVLPALAAHVEGVTRVTHAQELRIKESDRVRETVRLLAAFGVTMTEAADGYEIRGPQPLSACQIDVSADHRLALTAAVLALAAPGTSTLDGFEIANISYPSFFATLQALGAKIRVQNA